jgi:hypothetical protein
MSLTDLDRFNAACAYPGKLDAQAVERELAAFLRALGVRRRLVRLRAERRPEDDRPRRLFAAVRLARRLRALIGDSDFARHVPTANAALDARRASDAGAAVAAIGGGAAVAAPSGVVADLKDFGDSCILISFLIFISGLFFGLPGLGLGALIFSAVLHYLVGAPDLAQSVLIAVFSAFPALVGLVLLVAPVVLALAAVAFRAARAFAPFAGAASTPGSMWDSLASREGSMWELSWTACILFDAVERRDRAVEAQLRPLFEAFVCGCWLLHWANDALYWVAKPTLHREPGTQRLHHVTQPALASDVVNLYFWHGVMVPAFVVLNPGLITIADIDQQTNAEVRRVMIERYRHGEEIHGGAAFIRDAGGERLDHDECYGTLWRRNLQDDEPIVMIEVVNRTREPDGRFKHYWLRVPPTMQTAREAVAWTFNMRAERYAPEKET